MSKNPQRKNSRNIVKQPSTKKEGARMRKSPRYKLFKIRHRARHRLPPLPNWWALTKKTARLMLANKKNLIRFFLVYGLIYFVFVRGFSSPVDIEGIRDAFEEVLNKDISTLAVNFSVLALMLESTTSAAGEVQGMYQTFFLIVAALALIWLFRQQQAGNKVSMKDAFYRGMFPLVPFILVLIVISLQTIPASIGNYLFSTVITNNIAINAAEQIFWLAVFLVLIFVSTFWISSSLIALFIVTLPEMTPRKALAKAKKLVEFRRLSVMRKIIGLVFVVVTLFVAIVFPSIFISALLAQILYFVLTVLFVPFIIGYMFVLYRELL